MATCGLLVLEERELFLEGLLLVLEVLDHGLVGDLVLELLGLEINREPRGRWCAASRRRTRSRGTAG